VSDPISAAAYVPTGPSGDEVQRKLAGQPPIVVAREFESVLLTQLITAMRKTIPESGMLEASANRKMLDGAFDHEVAESLAANGGLGIAEQIVAQIQRQEHGRVPAPASRVAAHADAASVGASPTAAGPAARGNAVAWAASTAASTASGGVVTPVDGAVSSGFGMRTDPFTGEPRFHAGVDLAAPRGAAIRTVADGEVVYSGWRHGEGRVVEVQHAGGLVTSYAHAQRTLVAAGQHVVAGEVVATVGSSGRASGPHLHFAATRHGQVIDPTGLLRSAEGGAPAVAQSSDAT